MLIDHSIMFKIKEAKGHSRKRCKEDSTRILQRKYIEGKKQPLDTRLSSVAILFINLQRRKDLDGGRDILNEDIGLRHQRDDDELKQAK
jgi:hypothetical protein